MQDTVEVAPRGYIDIKEFIPLYGDIEGDSADNGAGKGRGQNSASTLSVVSCSTTRNTQSKEVHY